MENGEAEWHQRWQEGDALAFETLVRHWQEPVARLLGRVTAVQHQVPDLCQEVFLRVYHARRQFRGAAALSTWIYRIALNVAHDAARRPQLASATLNGQVELQSGERPVLTQCANREAAELIAQALHELPAPLREVLVLRHYEALGFEEMARITGTPASTLKSRFSAALQRLRVRLKELGVGPEEAS